MTKLNQIYKCNVCGNITEVLHAGAGELVCCGQPMVLQTENTVDASHEKHLPVIEKMDKCPDCGGPGCGGRVKIGSEPHPMTDEHYIEWIELTAGGKRQKKMLKPGDEPVAEFCAKFEGAQARAYCNLHGLWSA